MRAFMNFNNVEFEASFGTVNQLRKSECPEIVFSGKSNVGKSSLINKIVNRKNLARTSSKPGKTGTINFYKLDNFKFVDLPGYGYAKVSDKEKKRWANLMEGYFNSNRDIRLVLQIIDIRHAPSKNDLQMLDFLSFNNFKFIVVLTKADKLNKTQLNSQTAFFDSLLKFKKIKYIVFSALSGIGNDEIKNEISAVL